MPSKKKIMKANERRPKVAELYLAGKHQTAIAEVFGVSQATISRDLDAIKKDWQESALVVFDEIKAKELAKVDNLEREYWDAWQESKVLKSKDDDGEDVRLSKDGDPRFLSGVQWCIEQRLKIFGVYSAAKVEHSGDVSSEIIIRYADEN
jgi:hypothetical protein